MGVYLGSYAVDLYSMGADGSPTSSLPTLTAEQKSQMKSLMDQYFNNDSKFIYDGTARRQCYAYTTSGDISTTSLTNCRDSNDKYYLNCGLFAQMVWMGRAVSDFDITTPTKAITKAFDWGYYFEFLIAQNAFGVKKTDGSYYSGNTYTTSSGGTAFITFDNAASMANELYSKGYEIPYSQCDIGDLVFYRSSDISDGETDELEQTSFRYITHVAICYDVVDGTPVFMECTSAGTYSSRCTGRYGITKTPYHNASGAERTLGNLNLTRGAKLSNKVVMCARHPAAFGVAGNVPAQFATYK